MYPKKNLIILGLLLLMLFAGAVWLVSMQMDRTVNQMHYSMVEEMGLYRMELFRQDFRRTEELAERIQEFLEIGEYRQGQLERSLQLLIKLDHKVSRIWFETGGRGWVCTDSCVGVYRADTLKTGGKSGIYLDCGQYYWTLCRQYGDIVYGIDISLEHLHAYFSELLPAGKHYAYILNDSGVVIAHPDEKWLGMRVADSLEKERTDRVRGENKSIHVSGFSQFLLLPVDKMYSLLPVGNEKWVVVVNVVQLDNQENMAYFHRYSLVIVAMTVLVFSILLAYSQYRWRKEYHLRQKAEQEAMRLSLQHLKNQLNPHFLFNSLNSLNALIGKDPETARKFVLELSKVYRYVLEKRKENLTPVREEVDFIRHYYFLQKIRFGEQLNLRLAGGLEAVAGKIPAMSLQLIFENALKYNEITRQYPLVVDIYAQSGVLIMENSFHPRSDVSGESFGVGIESIQEIYRYYSDLQFGYEVRDGKFICCLPLIE